MAVQLNDWCSLCSAAMRPLSRLSGCRQPGRSFWGSLLCGYFVSAALFLTSARLMKRDILKLETVMQSGSLDAVCIDPLILGPACAYRQ